MTTQVNLMLRQDYPDGYKSFIAAAQKKYPNVNLNEAIGSCKALCWKLTKQIFIADPSKPLYADIAEALERAILAKAALTA